MISGGTRELADRLAMLAKSLERSGFEASRVSQFLMRCLFTMFAEDVALIAANCFADLLWSLRGDTRNFPDMVRSLWQTMDTGGFSPILRTKLRRFNGGLFEECEALPLNDPQLELLIEAARSNWREVEPAIFGRLLERALAPVERHKLGDHSPHAVERLTPSGWSYQRSSTCCSTSGTRFEQLWRNGSLKAKSHCLIFVRDNLRYISGIRENVTLVCVFCHIICRTPVVNYGRLSDHGPVGDKSGSIHSKALSCSCRSQSVTSGPLGTKRR